MKFILQEEICKTELNFTQWDYAFIGSGIDDRSNEAINFTQDNSKVSFVLDYIPTKMILKFNEEEHFIDDLEDIFKFIENQNIIIESSSLSFVEILLVLKQAKAFNSNITILYVEPESYNRTRQKIYDRMFELSGDTLGYIPIPGFSSELGVDKRKVSIFLAGYESERIERGIEENPISAEDCSFVFGVPAFKVGWEMNAFANNIGIIKKNQTKGDVYFTSANNPASTFYKLEKVLKSLNKEDAFFIAPVGPKPSGIAAALLAVEYENIVNILFDHPKKVNKRSKNIGKWHLYEIYF